MFPLNPKHLPKSMSSLFSAYASFTAFKFLLQTVVNELKDFIPSWVRSYIYSKLRKILFGPPRDDKLTLVINKNIDMATNEVYDKVDVYLGSKISPSDSRLELSKTNRQKTLSLAVEKRGQVIKDTFDDIKLKWSYVAKSSKKNNKGKYKGDDEGEDDFKWSFELTFDKKHRDKVIESYMPYVLAQAESIKQEERVLKLYNTGRDEYKSSKSCIDLVHPATFDTMAMDPELKQMIKDDLDRFVERRELYKRVGKAWKRGYLLYGPPGTGKSSLIAAMANYLKFDIYDLELSNIYGNSDLRRILLSTSNRSIVVVEDIDCSVQIKAREPAPPSSSKSSAVQASKFSLSGLLNFIDGLWSCCGDERIIVFTTNHKERLDPALLRPGRMDMHIHLSYCTPSGFRTLASNYLGIHERSPHHLFGEIESLIESTEVTPAAIAEELMKSDDADVVLEGLVKFLKEKKTADEKMKAKKAKKTEQERIKPKDINNPGVSSSWKSMFSLGLPLYGRCSKKAEEEGTKGKEEAKGLTRDEDTNTLK